MGTVNRVISEPWLESPLRTEAGRSGRLQAPDRIEYICVRNNRHLIDRNGQTVVPR